MRLLELIKTSTEYLRQAHLEEPSVEAELLVLYAAGTDRITAYRDNPETSRDVAHKIDGFLARRKQGEPLQYIIGYVDFLSLKISVGRGVLIPRPETELLAQEAIKEIRKQKSEEDRKMSGIKQPASNISLSFHILDLCCGSGCISLALAKEFPNDKIIGTDISETALMYARKNAETNAINNVNFLGGSLFEPIQGKLQFDLITANPPYIKTADIPCLQKEIREWEPLKAIDGGPDGLAFYRIILANAPSYLRKEKAIMLEIGHDQANAVSSIARQSGFRRISVLKDFAGIERILLAKK
jgi:release factor glutamine methyltransferase